MPFRRPASPWPPNPSSRPAKAILLPLDRSFNRSVQQDRSSHHQFPAGWQQWEEPIAEEELLKPGAMAPDFELKLAKGGKVKLSDYQGKIVWLYIWRAG